MVRNKRDLSAEFKFAKSKPDPRVNLNSHKEYTRYEKIVLITSSKAFIIAASILTLGVYYFYHVYCLTEASESPFNAKQDKKYEFVPWEKKDNKQENWKPPIEVGKYVKSVGWIAADFVSRRIKVELLELGVKIGLFFGTAYSWMVEVANRISKFGIVKRDQAGRTKTYKIGKFLDTESGFRSSLLRKFESRRKYINTEFDFEEYISNAIKTSSIKKKTDFYLVFVYWTSYILLSIVTLGFFPYWDYSNKHRREKIDFFEYRNETSIREFDGVMSRLTGYDVPFSKLLIQDGQNDLQMGMCVDLFRSSALRNTQARNKFIFLVNLCSFGLFGVVVTINNVLKSKKVNFEYFLDEFGSKRHLSWDPRTRKTRFNSSLQGLLWDLKALIFMASNKEFKIIESFRFTVKTRDSIFQKFVNTVLSYPYLFIFSSLFSVFLFTLFVLGFACSVFFFVPFIGLSLLYTKHIQFLLS